jgi:methylated-DNA-[protein]-cysteine S-methyltransferase
MFFFHNNIHLEIINNDVAVIEISFLKSISVETEQCSLPTENSNQTDLQRQITTELREYLDGKRQIFTIPCAFTTGTPFQQSVWKNLTQIPYGQTWSYQQMAESINNPKAVRAVGGALNKNPISIIIPCHRVIGKDGSLTGFGSGLKTKKKLLELEQARFD